MSASAWLLRIGPALAMATPGCLAPYEPSDTDATTSTSDTTTTTEAGPTSSSSGVTSGTGIQTVTSATTSASEGMSEGTTGPDVCATQVDALAAMLAAGQPCEVLVHLDDAAAPLGLYAVCGDAGMNWSAGKEIGDATECCSSSPTIYPPDVGAPYYVLHVVNPDAPDGVAILSNHTGRVVFDATTGEGGPGVITIPAMWTDGAELAPAMGCGDPAFALTDAQSYDLGQFGAALGQAELAALAAAIGDTALAPALARVSTPVRSLVVRYAPEEGGPQHDLVLLEVAGI